MPVYLLTEDLVFPPPSGASEEGLVAVGGDASPERLVLAYSQGIFPWPVRGLPLLWFSPDPRFVLFLDRVHVGRSLRRTIRNNRFEIRIDQAFEAVIDACQASERPGQDGTWITDELREGFLALHRRGYAHSFEAYEGDRLVGGLYGVSLGRAFFGESMFAIATDASKVAFVCALGHFLRWGFDFVDCQVHTDHLERFGAADIDREAFLDTLDEAVSGPTRAGQWRACLSPRQALPLIDAAAGRSTIGER